ncbi:MAG: hypothetical protein ACK55Z_17820, partial [bacterium]
DDKFQDKEGSGTCSNLPIKGSTYYPRCPPKNKIPPFVPAYKWYLNAKCYQVSAPPTSCSLSSVKY